MIILINANCIFTNAVKILNTQLSGGSNPPNLLTYSAKRPMEVNLSVCNTVSNNQPINLAHPFPVLSSDSAYITSTPPAALLPLTIFCSQKQQD